MVILVNLGQLTRDIFFSFCFISLNFLMLFLLHKPEKAVGTFRASP